MSSLLSRSELKTSAVSMDKDKEKRETEALLTSTGLPPSAVVCSAAVASAASARARTHRATAERTAVSSPPSPPFSPSAPPPLALGDPPEREEFRSLCIAAASSASEAATEA